MTLHNRITFLPSMWAGFMTLSNRITFLPSMRASFVTLIANFLAIFLSSPLKTYLHQITIATLLAIFWSHILTPTYIAPFEGCITFHISTRSSFGSILAMVSVALHCDIVVASSVGAASYRGIRAVSLLLVDPSYWDTVVKPLVLV